MNERLLLLGLLVRLRYHNVTLPTVDAVKQRLNIAVNAHVKISFAIFSEVYIFLL
jgi:hypothetical protein